jgi:aspartyl protease
MSINGVAGTFILDTGAPTTVSKEFADRIDLWSKATPFDVPSDADNPQPAYGAHYAPIESFTVGSIRGPRNGGQVLIVDLSHVSAVVGEKVDGFLGNSTLGSADYVLNVRRPSLEISGNRHLSASAEALPLKVGGFNGYRTYLPVAINGKSFDLLLDTGSNITVVTPEVLSALAGIETEVVERGIASINGVETGTVQRFRAAVKLGDVSVPEFTLFVGNGNRIGLDLLAFGELSVSVNERRFAFRDLNKP